uniref:Uncharacterized protein n=1 Tax=Chrysemys picta bellii TaxID=8478 RepID=A0A8C3FAR3_CHRPI
MGAGDSEFVSVCFNTWLDFGSQPFIQASELAQGPELQTFSHYYIPLLFAWWHMPVIPATWEAKAGRLLKLRVIPAWGLQSTWSQSALLLSGC